MKATEPEQLFITAWWAASLALVMFILTAALLHTIDGTNLTRENADVGLLALIMFFIISFGTIFYVNLYYGED